MLNFLGRPTAYYLPTKSWPVNTCRRMLSESLNITALTLINISVPLSVTGPPSSPPSAALLSFVWFRLLCLIHQHFLLKWLLYTAHFHCQVRFAEHSYRTLVIANTKSLHWNHQLHFVGKYIYLFYCRELEGKCVAWSKYWKRGELLTLLRLPPCRVMLDDMLDLISYNGSLVELGSEAAKRPLLYL